MFFVAQALLEATRVSHETELRDWRHGAPARMRAEAEPDAVSRPVSRRGRLASSLFAWRPFRA